MKRFLQKLVAFAVIVAVCFIPTWIFLGIRMITKPVGFWQNFATIGLGALVLGVFQVIGFLAFVYLSLTLWTHRGRVF